MIAPLRSLLKLLFTFVSSISTETEITTETETTQSYQDKTLREQADR